MGLIRKLFYNGFDNKSNYLSFINLPYGHILSWRQPQNSHEFEGNVKQKKKRKKKIIQLSNYSHEKKKEITCQFDLSHD